MLTEFVTLKFTWQRLSLARFDPLKERSGTCGAFDVLRHREEEAGLEKDFCSSIGGS